MTRVTFEKGAKVARIEDNLDNPTRALKQIGALMVAESQAAFRDQSFGGKRWKARASVNIFGVISDFHQGRRAPPQRRFQDRPALRDTGRLAASISFRLIGSKAVEVGSNLPYAGLHNAGGETESKPITEDVRRGLNTWLKTQGVQLRRRLGWILNKRFRGETLKMEVPKRQFVGITAKTRKAVQKIVGVTIVEVK